jgi:hypothetical protein
MMKIPFYLGLIAALPLAVSAAGQGFVNAGFETGDFTGWTLNLTANGTSPVQAVTPFDIDGGGPLPTSLAGTFTVGRVEASGVGGIELTQVMNLIGGTPYQLHYDWAVANTDGDTNHSGNAEGGVFDIIVNGTSIAEAACGSIPIMSNVYGTLSGMFTPASSGAYTIGARITRPYTVPYWNGEPCLTQYVDNFTPVPEPAALALLGLAALVLRRR